jgi:hypothetical protein
VLEVREGIVEHGVFLLTYEREPRCLDEQRSMLLPHIPACFEINVTGAGCDARPALRCGGSNQSSRYSTVPDSKSIRLPSGAHAVPGQSSKVEISRD